MLEQHAMIEEDVSLKPVRKNWHQGFLGLFPYVNLERMRVMERQCSTKCYSKHYFELFKMMACSLLTKNIYNVDELGVQRVVDKVE
jgi:hypothetical protein